MADEFRTYEIPSGAPTSSETTGSKPKFWFVHDELGTCLFKQIPSERTSTGEDWAEKVSSELGDRLGLPHARYELARWTGIPGVMSPIFVPKGGTLQLGNEILFREVPDYPEPGRRLYRVPQHTLTIVLEMVGRSDLRIPIGWQPPHADVSTPVAVFVGYLLLDAWISNTDRHHENWGYVIPGGSGERHLAPTFDHASSLGCHETDENRRIRLETRDGGRSVEAYVQKAASALYGSSTDKKPLSTIEALCRAAKAFPAAARFWINRLAVIEDDDIADLLKRTPSARLSDTARAFAAKMLSCNRARIEDLRGD